MTFPNAEQTQAAPPPPKFDDVVKFYVELRDKRDAVSEEMKLKIAKFDSKLEQLDAYLLYMLQQTGQTSSKTEYGTAYISHKANYNCTNWAEIYPWLLANGQIELLQKRFSVENLRNFETANKVLPPAVTKTVTQVVNVRRS